MRTPRANPAAIAAFLAVAFATLGSPPRARAQSVPPQPALLVATRSFLIYAEGDRRQAATAAGAVTSNYRLLGPLANGDILVAYDDGGSSVVESISPMLQAHTIKTFARGTIIFRGNDGFLTYDAASQLMRRYDAAGAVVGTPIAALGASDALGVGDAIVTLGSGRLRAYDRGGRLRHDLLFDGSYLTPLPDARFAAYESRASEVRVYTADLDQSAVLRYVGLGVHGLASAPDGTLAILAGTPSCTTSNAEVDVFTDLHAQPAARIHRDVTSTNAIAVGPDAIYVSNAPCRAGDEGSIAYFARDGTPRGTMHNLGSPTALQPFTVKH